MHKPTVLILPGWLGNGPDHWQSRWQVLHGYQQVEQHDWQRPLRGDWTARLQDAVLAAPAGPVLLVAPPDIARADNREKIPGWAPPERRRLPFAATVIASSNDPFGSLACASQLAADWGADFLNLGPRGHINADSGLGDWPEGHTLLLDLAGSRPT